MIFSTEFLRRCREVTAHYEKNHGTWSIDKQILKIYEEVNEVNKAQTRKEILDECCDVILASITIFDLLGMPYDRINSIMEETLRKVERRCVK